MELQNRKIVILGAGHVGSHAGYSLIAQGLAEEIVYIDIDQRKAEAQALDLFDATNYLPSRAKVRAGTYADAILRLRYTYLKAPTMPRTSARPYS